MSSYTVITGCSQGLGLMALPGLLAALPKRHILLACRDVARTRAAADSVAAASPDAADARARLIVLDEPCNLQDLVSVRAYAAAVRAHTQQQGALIDTLVLNAGIGGNARALRSPQGYDEIWATNHLGHFLLTLLLLPSTTASKAGARPLRVLSTSSEVHDPAAKTPLPDAGQYWPATDDEFDARLARGEAVQGEDASTSGQRRYSRSKLCNVLFTYALARRLSGATVPDAPADALAAAAALSGSAACMLPGARAAETSAFNPGLMLDTGFVAGVMNGFMGGLLWGLSPLLRLTPLGKLMRTSKQSGSDLATLASRDDLPAAYRGAAYYDGPTRHATSEFSRSVAGVRAAEDLWRLSLKWAQVTDAELRDAGLA